MAAALGADDLVRRGITRARDYVHFRPERWFEPRVVVEGGLSSSALAAELGTRGICIVPGLLPPGQLGPLRDAFDRVFVGPDGQPRGATDVPNAFSRIVDASECPLFLNLVLRDVVTAAVEAYYARTIYLAAIQADRLEPVAAFEGSSYQWHHDSKGKYVKAMWLLTDVGQDGQRMSYVAGSHRRLRVARSYAESRISDRDARASGEVVECVGSAGTLVLFETNGIHRGNRNLGPRRDVVFGVYSAGRHLHGCRFDPDTLVGLGPWQRDLLRRSESPSRGYERTDEG